jgi:DNA-directed RNA polymerase subunit RPC12/RpoP
LKRCNKCGKFIGKDHDCEASPLWKKLNGTCFVCKAILPEKLKSNYSISCPYCGNTSKPEDFEDKIYHIKYVKGTGKCRWKTLGAKKSEEEAFG